MSLFALFEKVNDVAHLCSFWKKLLSLREETCKGAIKLNSYNVK